MFYLAFENQLQLIVLLLFSSYIFLTGLTIKLQDPRLKALALSFFIPLVLSGYSFLVSPHNINAASLYLDLSWFLLILVLALISLIHKPTESLKFLYAVLFFLPIAAILMQPMLLSLNVRLYVQIIILALAAIELAMSVFCLISRNKSRRIFHFGVFMVSVGFCLIQSGIDNPLPAFSAVIAGLALCAVYFYRHSYGIIKTEHAKNAQELDRINRNVHVEIIKRVKEIEQSNRKLVEISKTDSMTGLYLKSATLQTLESMIERSPNVLFSLLMFDIDHFKEINDNLGHQIGDKCIKSLSKLMQTSFRNDDILGRYGGDEFIVILPGTSSVRSYLIADRFRQSVQHKTNPGITISVGIATYPEDGKNATSLIAAADKALYLSKQNGRNRVTNHNMPE